MNIKIIIPSYNPKDKLIDLVNELIKNNFDNILIIDDGSDTESKKIYSKIPKKVKIIYHDKNMGKGCALKTGIATIKKEDAFITVDSDGQHKVKDILKIKQHLEKNDVVIGKRNFNKKSVPFKSKLGNKISRIIFKFIIGKKCPDTQSGLRGINSKYKELCLNTEGNRFEYEMNILEELVNRNIKIDYIGIETVYENNNKDTNFKCIKDSFLIYKKHLKNLFISIIKILISFILFFISYKLLKYLKITRINRIFLSTVISYLIYISKNMKKNPSKKISIYIIEMCISFIIVYKYRNRLNLFLLKPMIDILIFILFNIINRIKR